MASKQKTKTQKQNLVALLLGLHLLIFFPIMGLSQNQAGIVKVPDYTFTHFTQNKIIFPGDTTCFYPLFKKFDNLFFKGNQNISIIHIGGSHVQADIFSHRMRADLLLSYPGIVAQRGLIFPFNVAKTNNPSNYKVRYSGEFTVVKNVQANPAKRLGITGMAVTTSDTAAQISITIPRQNKLDFSYTKVSILGYSDSGNVEPVLYWRDHVFERSSYDSLSCCYTFDFPMYVDSLMIKFKQNDTVLQSFTLTGIYLQNDLPGITYHAIGVNGASVPSYLKCELLSQDVKLLKPDLFIFGIGINDASGDDFDTSLFIRHYDTLISRIQTAAPECKFLFITNNDSYKKVKRNYLVNKNGLQAREAFYSLARKHNAGVWDLFEIMGGLGSMQAWSNESLAQRDKVHFTNQGYTILGDLLYNALMHAYFNYLSTSSNAN